jgi:hypothetical protein
MLDAHLLTHAREESLRVPDASATTPPRKPTQHDVPDDQGSQGSDLIDIPITVRGQRTTITLSPGHRWILFTDDELARLAESLFELSPDALYEQINQELIRRGHVNL